MNETIKVNKLDCAKRQLETAIELYFQEKDEISIHTLAAASYNILSAINKNIGGNPMMVKGEKIDKKTKTRVGGIFDKLWPEYHEEFFSLLQKPENFFKHAGRDYKEEIDFTPKQSEWFIYDAINKFQEIMNKLPESFLIFRYWFTINHPDIIKLTEEQYQTLNEISKSVNSSINPKKEFLNDFEAMKKSFKISF